ncbi:hypothetical protein AB1Y20_020607 [Prymnesium parvum]|uniref:Uncharacterized protein n=1 Tax=Prymnesium parvum TaxID=97485 RepID=A0AB34JU45_PRYPA
MSSAQSKHVQAELQPELDTFAAWERMSTNFSQLLRASFKEFHHSCRYYKGQGRSYNVWLRETYPSDFTIHLERADGGRQDLDYDRTEISPEELIAAAQRRRDELEAQGEIDWVADRQPYATGQGPIPDKALNGKMLEVRWRYRHKTTGEPVYIWCEGEVVQAADGETDKKSQRCRKVLPAGALRIKWPADISFDEDESYAWCRLNPKNFNKDVHLGWRFAGSELKRLEKEEQEKTSQKPSKKKPRVNNA